MIPKKIHYCWFGHGKKSKLVDKCIRSWKKYCPEYEIIEWNEDNYDVSSAPLFVKQALEAKQWAFAADYIRYQVVYEQGGIYFDTDVEVLRNPDFLLENKAFFGVQYNDYVASGLGFGAQKGTPILLELMKNYEEIPFILPDGQFDRLSCVRRDTPVFEEHGFRMDGTRQVLDGDVQVYPAEYFCPCKRYEKKPVITENTVTFHWFAGSWLTGKERFRNKTKKMLGAERFEKLKKILRPERS